MGWVGKLLIASLSNELLLLTNYTGNTMHHTRSLGLKLSLGLIQFAGKEGKRFAFSFNEFKSHS